MGNYLSRTVPTHQTRPHRRFSSRGLSGWLLATSPILITFAIFLMFCAVTGRIIARKDAFDGFEHFVSFIQPQWQFYPTVSECVRTVLDKAPRDKILVLIGGNSVFRGTGQNLEDLWSKNLQERLGDRYAVVNIAIDQAGLESFSGVLFRALERYYSKSIYVGTLDMRGFAPVAGMGVYEYLYWDAYYKGLITLNDEERQDVTHARWSELRTIDGLGMHLYEALDSVFYFSSIKNFISYRFASPDWTSPATWPFMRRNWYVEANYPGFAELQRQTFADKARDDLIIGRMKDFVKANLDLSGAVPALKPNFAATLAASFDRSFSPAERQRIIGVITTANPRYTDLLTADVKRGEETLPESVLALFRARGFNGLVAGSDYDPADFVDQGHLMASGGRKLAAQVATAVEEIAKQQVY